MLWFQGGSVIQRPASIGAFEFVVLATLRAAQLLRGCRPKIDGAHRAAVTAQLEVSAGIVTATTNDGPEQAGVEHAIPL
jgi:DNA-directed RNA polymerase subunit K/omega